MHWRFKSAVQRACSALPFGSEAIYYTIQRHFGNLKNPTPPWVKLEALRPVSVLGFPKWALPLWVDV